jgi:hypothetical protein
MFIGYFTSKILPIIISSQARSLAQLASIIIDQISVNREQSAKDNGITRDTLARVFRETTHDDIISLTDNLKLLWQQNQELATINAIMMEVIESNVTQSEVDKLLALITRIRMNGKVVAEAKLVDPVHQDFPKDYIPKEFKVTTVEKPTGPRTILEAAALEAGLTIEQLYKQLEEAQKTDPNATFRINIPDEEPEEFSFSESEEEEYRNLSNLDIHNIDNISSDPDER